VSRRGSLGAAGAALVLAGLLAVIALGNASSEAGERSRDREVKCTYRPETDTLFVRLKAHRPDLRGVPRRFRRLFRDFESSAAAAIELRIGEITVLEGDEYDEGYESGPIRCGGGTPTVANTDTVVVRKGKRVSEGYLFLDFRYGLLEPGLTDEGDGGSEIELDVDLDGGEVFTRMTRGSDRVSFDQAGGRTAINLNGAEGVDDADLLLGAGDLVYLQAGGSNDELLTIEGAPSPGRFEFIQILDGGVGNDQISGGAGPDGISGGFGSDRIDAGAGPDLIYALGKPDVIDCGPGRDVVLLTGRRHDLQHCELKESPNDFDKSKHKRKRARAKRTPAGANVVSADLRRWAKRTAKG
jgi:RTX calcium-binding nonapeptide repeat (4 copies)